MNSLGAYLKELRDKAGITQKRAAQLAGTTDSQISRLESGKTIPSPDILRKLIQCYDADALEMFQKCGYLNPQCLNAQCRLHGVATLSEEDLKIIQGHIDYRNYLHQKEGLSE